MKYIYNLDQHFAMFNSAGIYYLCYLGNDDLRIFDHAMDTHGYVFQKQKGKALLSSNKGWQELDDWFSYAPM